MNKRIAEWLLAERERWVLWLPVGLMAGMLLYFALPVEPQAHHLLPLAGLPFAARYGLRRWLPLGRAALALCVIAAGLVWAKLYTDRQDVTMLDRELRIRPVEGRVIEVSDVPEGLRLILDRVSIDGLPAAQTPTRVRVTLRGAQQVVTGEHINVRAGLLSPAGPVMPGGFDFARYFFSRGIGAVGYAIPPVRKLTFQASDEQASDGQNGEAAQPDAGRMSPPSPAHSHSGREIDMMITAFRQALSTRIRTQMAEPEGVVAAALMTGDRAGIPPEINAAMRDTNLSHILAISGMHMAIISGLVFVGMRLLLIAVPVTRHLRHGKKIAAAGALIAAACYLVVAGFPVSAVRAFIMVALLLGAVLLDREVTPMRSLMIAALVILLYNPFSPLDPGFQLSFIATAALIAWYERVRSAADRAAEREHYVQRIMIYAGGIMMTSLVAELATNFFVIYHFNHLSVYGILANLLAMPVVSFLIMPAIIAGFILMPFGIEYIALQPLEWGITSMLAIAQFFAGFPYARIYLPSFPGWAMAVISLGLLWLILWRERMRFLGLVLIALGLSSWLLQDFPDMLISKDAKQVAARINGQLHMLKGRAYGFIPQQWAPASAAQQLPYHKPQNDQWRCDKLGCIFRSAAYIVAIAKEHEALVKDCTKADIVIAPFYIGEWCSAPYVIDLGALRENGSHWLWFEAGGIRLQHTSAVQGARPWSVHQGLD